jgi:hypothetical protein
LSIYENLKRFFIIVYYQSFIVIQNKEKISRDCPTNKNLLEKITDINNPNKKVKLTNKPDDLLKK